MLDPSDPSRHVVLVVEADAPTRDAIGLALAQEGCQTILTVDGEEALDAIEQCIPLAGLYTLVELPGHVNGWDVGRAFQERWPSRPVVYASSRDWSGVRLTKGALFLRKPFQPSMMIAALTPGLGPPSKYLPD